MKRIAVTGGIGSGKSYVCQLLAQHGVKVYDCDSAAKRLMRTSSALQHQLSELVGDEVFPMGVLNKELLSRFIVASEENAHKVNGIVHPAVARDYLDSGCQWLESAILFESGFYTRVHFDYIVCVTAPLDVRISRIMSRDGVRIQRAQEWINRQMPQEDKIAKSHFQIINDGNADLQKQIETILQTVNNNL